MYNHSNKKQVKYSLAQLAGGLFYHLKNRKIEDISVTDICRKANVSRRTYYRNCENKEDLILYSTDYLVSELLANVDFNKKDPDKLYTNFFLYWEEHKKFLEVLYNNSLFDLFLEEFIEICNAHMRYTLQEESLNSVGDPEFSRRYSNAFVVGGFCQMLKEWTAEGFTSDAREIAGTILFLVPAEY